MDSFERKAAARTFLTCAIRFVHEHAERAAGRTSGFRRCEDLQMAVVTELRFDGRRVDRLVAIRTGRGEYQTERGVRQTTQ